MKNVRMFWSYIFTSEKTIKKWKRFVKRDKQIIKFYGTKIEEYKFRQYKSPISINDIDINEIVVSNKFSFGKPDFKYFIGYKDNTEIRPLCIFFPDINKYKRYTGKVKCMSFIIKGEKNIW